VLSFPLTARTRATRVRKGTMSEQREPDQSEDPRGQDVGDGYPEVNKEGADLRESDEGLDEDDE
jgi:hypothetical protein